MIRGLCSQWKQPIYVEFDQNMTNEILLNTIHKLYEIDYHVVACISDCGAGNRSLWTQLNISEQNPSFPHPVTKEKSIYFPDVPHILKLTRNWFLVNGFQLENGIVVNKTPVVHMLKGTSQTEVTVCHKLTQVHLECERTKRQNVRLAAQLMSHSVGTALLHYTPGQDKNLAINTGKFLIDINQWFDMFNIYMPKRSLPHNSPYGFYLQEQNEILKRTSNLILNMRCIGKNSLEIFQKGILMTCAGLPMLLDTVQKYRVQFILTHRLNQDTLENLFGQIRSKGGVHDHPSPLNALYKLRLIILGKTPGIIQSNCNPQNLPDMPVDEFVLSTVTYNLDLKSTDIQKQFIDEKELTKELQPIDSNIEIFTNSNIYPEIEEDELRYLAGWIAHKFRTKYPELGNRTSNLPSHEYDHTYTQHLSFGGLVTPSAEFFTAVNDMEAVIKTKLVTNLPKGEHAVANLTNLLEKK